MKTSNIRWLLGFARGATRLLVGSIASRLVSHAAGAALLVLAVWAVGIQALETLAVLLPGESPDLSIGWVLFWFVLLALIKAGTRYTEQLLGHLAAFRLMGEMRVWMIDRLIPQAPAVTDSTGAARLNQVAIKDVDRVEVFFAHTIAPVISAVVMPVAAVVFTGFTAGWATAIVLAVVLAIGVVLPLVWHRISSRTAQEQSDVRGELTQHVADSVRMKDQLVSFQAVGTRLDSMGRVDDRLGALLVRSGRQAGWRKLISDLRVYLGTSAVALVGIFGPSPIWGFACATLVFGTNNSLEAIERLAQSLPAGLSATGNIRRLAAQEPAVTEPAEPVETQGELGLRLEDVSFRYPGATASSLENISLDIAPGRFVGITGATGSGKSTLAGVLHRHIAPTTGDYLLGEVPASALGSEQVQARVAMVEQNPFFINGTIGENLRLANEHATDETLDWALTQAGLTMPLDRPVGRRAAQLSGGQRQRLAVARALVRIKDHVDSGVLILDEATSHQDPLTQQDVMERIRGLGLTLVVIAHRLETLKPADEIIVLEAGRLVERGTYAELEAAGGAFSHLLNS